MNEYYAKVVDANNLMSSARKCLQGVDWKYSSQSYYLNRIERVRKTQKRLINMERISDGFVVFYENERGKVREISSIHVNERVVHRCENDFVLMPVLKPKLIYDTYSSLPERGTRMCLERLKCNLQREFRRYGDSESYILVADLHAYFKSINHGRVYEQYSKIFKKNEPKILYLTMDFIDAFGEVSLGLGSQVSQGTAGYYPNDIDHYIKEQLKIKGYGRYNDDFYLIHRDKEYLVDCCLPTIRDMYAELGIDLNKVKTRVCKVNKEFKFLKAKIHMSDTGKIYMRPDHDCLVRERRKLKKMKEKLDRGELEFADVEQQYKSWKGHIEYFDSYRSVRNIDKLFNELFIKDWRETDMAEKKNAVNESTEAPITSKDNIQLKDGTVLNLLLNGTEYESETKIDKSIFTTDNLSNVVINGERRGQMVLHSFYDFGEGTRFTLREMTEFERLQAEMLSTQIALAEVYEMQLSSM